LVCDRIWHFSILESGKIQSLHCAFTQMSWHTANLGMKRLCHCTNSYSWNQISQSRVMRPGNNGLFGPGIYFTEAEWSARHKCAHHDPNGPACDAVLWATVNLGTTLVVEGTRWKHINAAELAKYGCTSLMGRSHSGAEWEYVVYDSARVTIP
jgi:hypothetical protein